MIIDNKEVSEEFIKQLMLKMGKEQEEENLNMLKEKLLSINVPEIDLTYSEKMIKCLEYDVFDCFNIYGIRYYDLEEIQQNSDIQLTDDSVYTNIFDFSSNNIAGAKQMKHVLDYLILGKRLDKQEYHKYKIVPNDTACWGSKSELDLDLHKVYYGLKIDKNRGGEKDKIPVVEVDLNKNIWKELGYLIKA